MKRADKTEKEETTKAKSPCHGTENLYDYLKGETQNPRAVPGNMLHGSIQDRLWVWFKLIKKRGDRCKPRPWGVRADNTAQMAPKTIKKEIESHVPFGGCTGMGPKKRRNSFEVVVSQITLIACLKRRGGNH